MNRTYTEPSAGETAARRAAYVKKLQSTDWIKDDLTELREEQRAVDPDEWLWSRFAPKNLKRVEQ